MPALPRIGASVALAKDNDSGSSSDESEAKEQRVLSFFASAEDPKTLSQIKRSRIDLSRRYVFLCPMSLSKHFDSLPHQAKDCALLVFRCSRTCLFQDMGSRRSHVESKLDTGRSSTFGGGGGSGLPSALCRNEYSKEFLNWLLIKEKEGCVFWYKPERDMQKLSRFFEEKIDPVNEQPYRPLLLDPQWWRVRFQRTSARFIGNPSLVVAAISERSGGSQSSRRQDIDIPALQELIYQSNPTLEPISKWPHAPSMRFLPREGKAKGDVVGQDAKSKGYIDQAGHRSPGVAPEDESRIGRWPEKARDRFDNLHVLWQTEDSSFERHQCFAMHGRSLVGPLSAR